MSGTSLDGLDMALCRISNSGFDTAIEPEHFITIPFTETFRNDIRGLATNPSRALEMTCRLNTYTGKLFAGMINEALKKWNVSPEDVDLIASHGQTIFHAPLPDEERKEFGCSTLQIGDGDRIAAETGIITISDFRQKHIAAGGQGAPLAPYGDYLLFSEMNSDVLMLNIGGIANFTWLPAGRDAAKIVCSDTGPGNTLMDAQMQRDFRGRMYDEGGQAAAQGKVIHRLLDALLDHPFFNLPLPKTTGTELFNRKYLEDAMQRTGIKEFPRTDIMATLNYFTAASIASAIRSVTAENHPLKLYVSGGGVHNKVLIDRIRELLHDRKISYHSTLEKNINPDAKEAILFALLANECVAGDPSVFGKDHSFLPATSMGKISLPG
jgi:anhydro-N-acetylmuramic acid kinase